MDDLTREIRTALMYHRSQKNEISDQTKKFTLDAANKLKDAVERNKKVGYTLEAIQDSVEEWYNELEVGDVLLPDMYKKKKQ